MQIAKNGVMDLKNAMFLAHTFRVSPYTVREVYNRFYPGAHNGLTRPQFFHVMRTSMNMGGGSDGDGLTDRGRDLHRSFSITDAPLDASRLPTHLNPKLSVDSQSEGDTKADTGLVADIANGIRSLESTLVLRETQRGKPLTPTMTSRFFQGSVTPRRISTACFVPSQRNLTMAARRPTTADERAFLIRGNGGNRLFNGGQTAFSREQYGESAWAGWVERTGKCSEINPFAPIAYTRPRTAAEMGRTVKVQEGTGALLGAQQTDSELSEDAERHSRTLIEKISTQLRRLNVQRVDALQPFEHFDVGGTGQVSLKHARIALAEIDVTLSLSAIREISTVLNALGKNDSVKYPILVGALCPVVTDTKSRTKVAFIPRNTSKRWCSDPSLSVTGMPLGVSDAFLNLANATQGVQELFADQLRVLDVHKTGRCNPAGVKDVLKAFLSEAQAEMMCNYLVAENNKISLLSEHGLIQYSVLLRTMHKETALRKKAAGERPIFLKDGGSYTQKPKIPRAKTMLDIPEPSARRRTGLASVYKKMNSQVRSPSKLQMVFESVDTTLTGTVSLDSFHAVLEKLNIRLATDETIILMEQLDPQKTGKVVYAEFIALMFPPEIIRKDEQVFVPAKPTFGPESLQASISSMAGLSNENILKILRDGCYRALAAGPEKIKQEYSIFRMPGDSEVTASDVKRFALDFGYERLLLSMLLCTYFIYFFDCLGYLH
jgi:Ca2+-binding EF-hand superfamily protein